MKTKLNILCILLLIAFGGCMYNGFWGGIQGSNDASRGDIKNRLKPLYNVNIVPLDGNKLTDSIPSILQKGEFLKYNTTSIKIEQETTSGNGLFHMVIALFSIPCLLIILLGLYCFFRLILSIHKKDIFNLKNVHRLRFISIAIIILGIFDMLKRFVDYDIAVNSIQLTGYEVKEAHIPWNIFLVALLLAVFAEIYAQAIKLKEEQDLTI